MTDNPGLKAAYALKTPDDSRALYADWAESYDSDFVSNAQYILHQAVAQAFVAASGSGPVLDMGAGTGVCGAALGQLGAGPIIGTDISPEMLEQAKTKGVYQELFVGDILAGLPVKDGLYAGVVSSGTFTSGHVGPDGLNEVLRVLRSGGLAVVSVRDDHFEKAGFAAKLSELEPLLAKTHQTKTAIYDASAEGPHAKEQAVLLHLWKA